MFKSTLDKANIKQATSYTGVLTHAYTWLTSYSGDQFFFNPNYKAEEKENETAIYFIHGTADFPAAFKVIAERLIQTGLPQNIFSLNLIAFEQRYQGRSIEYFAEQLKNKIVTNQHKRVIFIAHSRGGLVASYCAEYLAAFAGIDVPMVFTIGTPFNGSYLAIKPFTWFSDSVREMEVGSDFLMRLKKNIIETSKSTYYFFVAKDDAIVPTGSGYIQEYVALHPHSLSILEGHGHLSVMSSHKLVSLITSFLCKFFNPILFSGENEVRTAPLEPHSRRENYFAVM